MPCERGKFCKFASMRSHSGWAAFKLAKPSFTVTDITTSFAAHASYYGNCNKGYICLEGSTNPAPTNAAEGYECPAGYYCPTGAILELPCPPGYYNPSTK